LGTFCDDANAVLQQKNGVVPELGKLMHEGWMLKRDLTEGVSTPAIDDIYHAGREAAALGGKLLGAGGGGFMLFLVEPDKQKAVKERLKNLIHVNFEIDTGGSKIVVFEPDENNGSS